MPQEQKKLVFRQFIDVYFQLLNMIKDQVGNHTDFKIFYRKNIMMKKTNVKLFIKTWYESMTVPHYTSIMNENKDFFMEHGTAFLPDPSFQTYFEEFKIMSLKTEGSLLEKAFNKIRELTQLSLFYYQ
tara:strand:- start:267 stop:650 length:384 start_codon:yes stop_codon:yes gene_type:complete